MFLLTNLVGRIDPVIANTGNIYPQIAWDGEQSHLTVIPIHGGDHERVGIPSRLSRPLVGAEDQDVLRAIERARSLLTRERSNGRLRGRRSYC